MRKSDYPKTIRSGSVTVRLYRVKHPTTKSGFAFTLGWVGPDGRPKRKQFADEDAARDYAKEVADLIGSGRAEAAEFTQSDREELFAARDIVAATGTPLLSAVREWEKATRLCPGELLAACEAWVARQNLTGVVATLVGDAVDDFIAEKEAAGKHGELTYRARLRPAVRRFATRHLHTITAAEWQAYLETFADGVTRNDHRKRAAALCRWAQRKGRLPRHAPLEILETERAKENVSRIGTLTADEYGRILVWMRDNRPELLGAVVLAGFCGLRSAEIHGKETDRTVRQLWSDVHLDRKVLQVSVAKTNTPAWRIVPLCDAAVEWLRLCPKDEPTVCGENGFEYARRAAIGAGFDLPENCFRHSYISHRVAQLQDKPRVALEAGNSVKEIDRRYRIPLTESEGRAWFGLTVAYCDAIRPSPPKAPSQT